MSEEGTDDATSSTSSAAHLVKTTHPGLWLWTTLKNRSHVQNPGDQHINLSLRRLCRRRSKLRIAQHFMNIQAAIVPPSEPLPMGETVLKPCLMDWVTEWLNGDLRTLIRESWAMILRDDTGALGYVPPAPVQPPPAPLQPPSATHVESGNDSYAFSCPT